YLGRRAARLVAGDTSPELLEEARRHVPDADLVHFSAEEFPFPDASFDVVLMLEMIYYVGNQERAIAEARRTLRNGGRLLLCLPNRERPDFNPSPYSTHYPSAMEIKALLEG